MNAIIEHCVRCGVCGVCEVVWNVVWSVCVWSVCGVCGVCEVVWNVVWSVFGMCVLLL